MHHPPPREDNARFSGTLRHYHRAGARPSRSWDEWIDGASAGAGGRRRWGKIIGITTAVLALAGIIAGLVIELW